MNRWSVWCICILLYAAPASAGVRVWWPLGYNRIDAGGHRYFAVAADGYRFVYDLGRPSITELCNHGTGPNLLGHPAYIRLVDGAGKDYRSYLANGNIGTTYIKSGLVHNVLQTRMSVRQAGRVYYRVDVNGIKLAASDGSIAPVTVRQRFHLWPERFCVETAFTVHADCSVMWVEAVSPYNPAHFGRFYSAGSGDVPIAPNFTHYLGPSEPCGGWIDAAGANGAVSHVCVDRSGTDSLVFHHGSYAGSAPAFNTIHRLYDRDIRGSSGTWRAGEVHTAYSQQFFSEAGNSSEIAEDGQLEASPASVSVVTSSSGQATMAGYDRRKGCFVVYMPSDYQQLYCENDYANFLQNHYETARLRIANGASTRPVRIQMDRGPNPAGTSPWGEMVVTDPAGFPLGFATEQNSNWNASQGDPDSLFSCYTSLPVGAGETRDVVLKLVYQNWGRKPMIRMQCQDLQAWEYDPAEQQWMQSSIGQGEHMVYYVQRVTCTVNDARGLNSNLIMGSSAWRENCGGWEFLKLWGNTRPESRGLVYHKSGPNLFDFDLTGEMDDGSITSSVRVIAVPCNELTRTFFRIRYDVKKNLSIGSIPANLRLFAQGDEYYAPLSYPQVAYTGPSGSVVTRTTGTSFTGRQIGGSTPWAVLYGSDAGNRGFVLRSYRARIQGVQNDTPAITVTAGAQTRLALTALTSATSLSAGDYFEFEIDAVAFGNASTGYSQIETEVSSFAAGLPSLSVHHGTKLSDFPGRVDAVGGWAEFTIAGGRDIIPVEVGGFTSASGPNAADLRVEEMLGGVWAPLDQSAAGRDWWQTEIDPTSGMYSFVMAIHTDGSSRRLRVSHGLTRADAEQAAAAGPGLAVFQFPAHAGGGYVAAAGNSPIGTGEWFEHSLTHGLGTSRRYTPIIRYSAVCNSMLHIEVNGVNQTGPIDLPATGGAAVWKTLAGKDVVLDPGQNVVRTVIDAGGCYIDYIDYRFERPVSLSTEDAVCLADDVPFNVSSNAPVVNTISVLNTGTAAWAAGQYGLCCEDEFGASTWRPLAASVPQGGSYTFKFASNPPPTAVKLAMNRWQMKRHDGGTFGTPVLRPQRSTDFPMALENVRVMGDDVPTAMGSYEARIIRITLLNTGTTTWGGSDLPDPYGLALADSTFGTQGNGPIVTAGKRVQPGSEHTFPVSVRAPAAPGVYTLRLRLLHRGVGWVGPYVVREIEVVEDATPPSIPIVTDDGLYTASQTSLHASWSSSDPESGVAGYRYAVGTSPADSGAGYVVGWMDVGTAKSATVTGLSLVNGVSYYFYVKARNGSGMWSAVGASNGIKAEFTPPTVPVVTDDGAYTLSTNTLRASWSSTDPESGVFSYQFAIGTSQSDPGSQYVVGWTNIGSLAAITRSGLQLANGSTYYFYVRAQNAAGLWSTAGVSDGITAVRHIERIAEVRAMPPGSGFLLPEKNVAAVTDGVVFIEEPDRSCAIRLNWSGSAPGLATMVAAAGRYVGVVDAEPTADAVSLELGSPGAAAPLGLRNAAVGWPGAGSPPYAGIDTRGLLLRIWGRVTHSEGSFFLVDDGSGVCDWVLTLGRTGIKVSLPVGLAPPAEGSTVLATGISRASADGTRWLMPRGVYDVQVW